MYNFIHHKVANNSKNIQQWKLGQRNRQILANLHTHGIYRSEYNDIQCTFF